MTISLKRKVTGNNLSVLILPFICELFYLPDSEF